MLLPRILMSKAAALLLVKFIAVTAAPAFDSDGIDHVLLGRDGTVAAATSSASTTTSAAATVTASSNDTAGLVGYTNLPAASSAFSEAGLGTVAAEGTTTIIYNTAPPAPSILATPAAVALQPVGGSAAGSYQLPAFLSNSLPKDTSPHLPQSVTNGNSTWGTSNAPLLNPFCPGPLQNGWPWGTRTANNTNYYDESQIPNTGVTRTYQFAIASATIAPDGVQIPGLVVNGQFPGPLIEANWGDWISVTVTNELPDDGTSLHWHGFLQKGTPYYDGTPSVQQCPIAPSGTFTYTFRADLYGTSWYHSHYSAQYSSGLLGPIVVHGPTNVQYDIDLGPVMLNDWYHADWHTLVEQTMTKASSHIPPPISNNNLINGKMNYPCLDAPSNLRCTPNAGLSKFKFTAGKKHRLRLINSGAEAVQKFSIDGHKMTVMANDFVQIDPYVTDLITLGVGQRTDIVVEADGNPNSTYWMRANISLPCSLNDGISPDAVAVVYYDNATQNAVPTSVSTVDPSKYAYCGNDPLSITVPYMPLTPDPKPPVTQELNIVFTVNATGYNVWEVNGESFRGDYNDPTLLEAKLGNFDFPPERNVHGHNFFVLAEGHGLWDGHITNPANPQRRDVQLLQPAVSATQPSYIVLQIKADNPSVWPFHCHIAWHVSGGLYVNILERPRDIYESNIPMVMAQTCRDWARWSHTHVVDQIDSGL
ncbi:hypothetical protein ANO11243_048100 [Dothideomycetidae sp. 11243]|nr:hypothetical protein ANO11243_048100 [fungal sp. No.11243]